MAEIKKKKILVVDDDKDFCTTLRQRLEVAGYATLCAYEGIRAIELAHKEHPDLILLDWRMPSGKGGVVLEALSTKDDTRKIPVIIISGADDSSMFEKSQLFGVKEIMMKPYDAKVLMQKIREALQWKDYEESLTLDESLT